MADNKVRVWISEDRSVQHYATPPSGDETSRAWEGTTDCGQDGPLEWVHHEHVDGTKACKGCVGVRGHGPPLEGNHPGPP